MTQSVEYPPLLELHKSVKLVFPNYQIPDYLKQDNYPQTRKKTNPLDLMGKKYRCIVFINKLIKNESEDIVEITIPSWNVKTIVQFPSKAIQDDIPNIQLKPNMRLFALVNVRAKSANDLNFSNFELAPEVDDKDWFELMPEVTKDNELI